MVYKVNKAMVAYCHQVIGNIEERSTSQQFIYGSVETDDGDDDIDRSTCMAMETWLNIGTEGFIETNILYTVSICL